MSKRIYEGLEYACCKGRMKRWARETLIMDALYDTKETQAEYVKVKDIGMLPVPDKMTDDYYIYRFGYQYRIPKTDITLYINKKDGMMFIKRGEVGFGWEEVEKAVYKFVEQQIKKKNVYLQTNLNNEEVVIR